MIIRINGKSEEVGKEKNLSELLLAKGLCAGRVVVEHNLRIVPKEDLERVILQDNDSVEIVSFVAGG